MNMNTDVLIIGSGVAGLFCALNLPADLKITILTKDKTENSDSYLAQGGICVERDDGDYKGYFEDTMRAGHYENDEAAVGTMIRASREVISDLIGYGVEFAKKDGAYLFTREGGHSKPRILFHEDATGKEIMTKLIAEAGRRKNIEIREFESMIDILCAGNECRGAVSRTQDGGIHSYSAPCTVFACGGVGGLYQHSTNFRHITGDGIAIALDHGVETEHVNYVQIHPTTLYAPSSERCILISESVRGEGAVLCSVHRERFTDELQPRDIVTKAILGQMEIDHSPYVLLDMRRLGREKILSHFPNIYDACLQKGYNVLEEYVPVVPAQHYLMGGIKVDLNSKTSMDRLYAVGETSCNGVHGANRLASNSLLESLVFSKRAASEIAGLLKTRQFASSGIGLPDPSKYADAAKLKEHYKTILWDKIRSNADE
jgi:L-aspartate oxidase